MSAAELDVQAIAYFRNVARRGAGRGASNGERIANRLAVALHSIGDDAALLDCSVIEGACDLLRCMAGPWATNAGKAAVFRTVREAAGKG